MVCLANHEKTRSPTTFFLFCRLGIDVRKTHSGMPGGDIYTSGSIYNRIPGDTLSDQHSMIRYGSLTQFLLFSNAFSSPQTQVRLCENPRLCGLESDKGMGEVSTTGLFCAYYKKPIFLFYPNKPQQILYEKSKEKRKVGDHICQLLADPTLNLTEGWALRPTVYRLLELAVRLL